MTPSARAAALRSTALATSLALAVGLSALAADAWAKPKVPLPKPRPIARNVVPKTVRQDYRADAKTAARSTAPAAAPRPPRTRARDAPACGLAAAARKPPPPAAVAATSSTSQADTDALENVIELVRKHKPADATQAEAAIIGSGREETRGMDHPAQRRQRRVGRALSRLHRRPIRAGRRRPSCAGASRRRCGTTIATTPRCGRGSKTNRRCRPRASSRWRGRCSRAATAPMPSVWCATPGATIPCPRTPRARRSTCSARC